MIKMKALKTFGFDGANEGPVKRGREFTARDLKRAQELEAHGLAYRLDSKMQAQPQNKMLLGADSNKADAANKAAEQGPFVSAGGATGATAPAPSSPPVRQPRRRRSSESEGGLLS